MPPAITAAIISKFPSASCAVPNTYAALLTGPPMSTDIMPPTTAPRITLLVPPMPFKKWVRPSLIAPTNGLINVVATATRKMPSSGYKRTGLMPSRDLGSFLNTFFNRTTI